MTAKGLALGIDLGGTKTTVGVVDQEGRLLWRSTFPTLPQQGPEAWMERVVLRVQEAAGAGWTRIGGVGVGSPGPLDLAAGRLLCPPNLGWRDVPLRAMLSARLSLPVALDNDANAAGLGEARYGRHGPEAHHLVYVTVSTGIGSGVILDGQIFHGAFGNAGEIGHVTVLPEGPRCRCGSRGCLEALAAGPAIARRAADRLKGGEKSLLTALCGGDLGRMTAETVAQAAAKGDTLAAEILYEAFRYLGIGIATLIALLDPGVVVVGGGVSRIGEPLFRAVRAEISARTPAALPPDRRRDRIRASALGEDAGVIGAAALAFASSTDAGLVY